LDGGQNIGQAFPEEGLHSPDDLHRVGLLSDGPVDIPPAELPGNIGVSVKGEIDHAVKVAFVPDHQRLSTPIDLPHKVVFLL
jgi:hypothetical protein